MTSPTDRPQRILPGLGATLLGLAALGTSPSAQATWYVDDDGAPGGNGSSAQPFQTIQAGVQAAVDGDLVLVLPGTYVETVNFLGKEITVRSRDGAAVTRIDPSSGRAARFASGETTLSVLEGFTLHSESLTFGGGLLVLNSGATILDCVVQNCSSFGGGGGGIAIRGSTASIVGCLVQNNGAFPTGAGGGGLYIEGSDVEISGSRILDNVTSSDPIGSGAGIYVTGSTVTLTGNLIANNTANDTGGNRGGGIYATGTSLLTMESNTLANNRALPGDFITSTGGGVFAGPGVTLVLRRNVLWGNTALVGAQLTSEGSVDTDFDDLQGGQAAIGGSGVVQYGAGNIASDPLFVDPAARDYHVPSGSPVVDAGGPAPPGGVDGDLEPRLLDGDADGSAVVDIGWDELDPTIFEVTGSLVLGGMLTLQTSAPANQVFFHLVGPQAIDVPLAPYGSLLVGAPLYRLGAGLVPGSTNVTIPMDPSFEGVTLHFQSLARRLDAPVGAFSRRISGRVQ